MSAVRLLVLGVIRAHGEAHGYAVHRELMSWRVDTWTAVKPPSIYHAVKQLAREQRLTAVGPPASARGPARTGYRLTEVGEREFFELLEEALRNPDIEEFGAGVAFMRQLSEPRVRDLLTERLQTVEQIAIDLVAMKPQWPDAAQPPHAAHLLELWAAVFQAQARWTADLLAGLGGLDFAPGLPHRSR
ncbi:PadR family transcriptional regulator [Mycolicibacterium brumae]|uniref:PadR family transcriptional regulator n=1 Tax=Mycolicibacterium brumae TaxID=85968 RepID=A0A2G5PAH2_9MYCO|nr:helix-turn-helix transcriptional regulator [Mycolicibacterium brumae]MCV7193038.1 PadR family transcriptional regulator [Mycolicibacterium brumae]PIB75358.1 PadR family transcriptional regulator [Mycolicibacterium brumae]RWA22037.1 hypothetical protein MBRU_13715 [Mycolicibacterium brumae DSM 44177]UWW07960.1 helix-turn-helix transcriptional regulator [Mycolicibacterium brumae]